MKKIIYLMVGALLLSSGANAALIERLGGLAYYDDQADMTWLADANYAQTQYVSSGGTEGAYQGEMNWAAANAWANGLNINGVTGWRLPATAQPDAACSIQSGGASFGYECTGSEMGNLIYNVMGGERYWGIRSTPNENYNLFSNVMTAEYYWSSTENVFDADLAWSFSAGNGFQTNQDIKAEYFWNYAWAVHTGDVGVVPVPAAIWLFGSGLIGLLGLSRYKRAT